LGYSYNTIPALNSISTSSYAITTATFVTASPGFATSSTTATLAISTQTSSIESIARGINWKFNDSGNIIFPDGTQQTTAYPGPGSANIGEYSGRTPSTGTTYTNVPVAIKHSSGYIRLTGVSSTAQTWLDLTHVAQQLSISPYWISGMVIDYQIGSCYTSGSTYLGNMVGQIIISCQGTNDMTVTHSESVNVENNGDSNIADRVFSNLNIWQVSGNTLQVSRNDSITYQQLDFLWSAKVFINASEAFC